MKMSSVLSLAWNAVRANPLRTVMTVMGVTWGVMSFMILMAYGEGMSRALALGLSYFGDNVVVVQSGQTSKQAGGQKAGRVIRLEKTDVEMVREEAPLIKKVSGEIVRWLKVEADQRRSTACVRAVDSPYEVIRGMFMESGRFFTSEENAQLARCAVLGSEIKERLFSRADAVGKQIKINGIQYSVAGVLKKKIAISNYYTPDDMCVFVPFETASLYTGTRYTDTLVYQPVNAAFEERAKKQFWALMAKRHNFDPTDDKALTSWGYSEVKAILDGIMGAMQATMLLVGAFTLGVGGVGVMNIMLLSVRSRTREIGTVMALGAKRRHVTMQFLTETLIMTAMGGILGYALAAGLAHAIGGIPFLGGMFNDTSGQGDIFLRITFPAFATSLVVLGAISVAFGLWPARQAAKRDPVEALRYE